MWATVSVLQMMSYITMLKLYFPMNLLKFLDCIESVHDFNKWFPNPFAYVLTSNKLNMEAYNEQFENRGFKNRNMLLLCGSDLVTLCLIGVAILILIPISQKIMYFS